MTTSQSRAIFPRFSHWLSAIQDRATLHDADLTADEGYQPIVIPFVARLDRDLAIRRAWAEATGQVTRTD